MSLWNGLGILGILLVVVLIVVCVWFGIVTATLIATAIGATGWNWWIVAITIFGTLGGCSGGLVKISRD